MGAPLEHHKRATNAMTFPWESHGSTMGVPWKCYILMRVPCHGASMGLPWDIYETSMGFPMEFRWTLLCMGISKSQGDSNASMVPDGTPMGLSRDSHCSPIGFPWGVPWGLRWAYIGAQCFHESSRVLPWGCHGVSMGLTGKPRQSTTYTLPGMLCAWSDVICALLPAAGRGALIAFLEQ